MKSTRKLDLLAGLLFICVAAVIIWVAIPHGVQEPKKVKFAALSPSYYPRLVGYCLLLFGLVLLITRGISAKHKPTDENQNLSNNWIVVLIGIAVTLSAYYFSLEFLGFVLASSIALFILLLIAGERSVPALLLIPALLPLALHLFFTKVANIPIPSGFLQPLIGGA